MGLLSIGVNHRTAPVEVRERLAFDEEQTRRFLTDAAEDLSERLLVSTCNRTELYAVTEEAEADPIPALLERLGRARGIE